MSQFIEKKIERNRIIFVFTAILIVYTAVFLTLTSSELTGDEKRYFSQATNLTKGFFIRQDRLWIDNGPGYPLLLALFVKSNIDLGWTKAINPLLMTAAFWFAFATARLYVHDRYALMGTALFAAYFPFFRDLGRLLSEPLACVLISVWVYLTCKIWMKPRIRFVLIAGIIFGYLCLTKVIFGYVLLLGILGFGSWSLFNKRLRTRYMLAVFILAGAFCTPYLLHTNALTGKAFHWADMGAYNLYWMSSPYPNDSGDWHRIDEVFEVPQLTPHRDFFRTLRNTPFEHRSALLVQAAIENITEKPFKYIQNWVANLGRMAFNYPHDFTPLTNRTFFYILPNTVVILLFSSALVMVRKYRIEVPLELFVIVAVGILVLGGISLLHANPRMVQPILFILFVPMLYGLTKGKTSN